MGFPDASYSPPQSTIVEPIIPRKATPIGILKAALRVPLRVSLILFDIFTYTYLVKLANGPTVDPRMSIRSLRVRLLV